MIIFSNLAYAQTDDSVPDDIIDTIHDSELYLWVPEKMIKSESYEGMIVLKESGNEPKLALISSSNEDIITVVPTILVDAHANHGIFQITPKSQGIAEIFVSINGKLTSKKIQVYSQKSGAQSLELILPSNSTSADKMTAFVFSLDGNGSPAPVSKDTEILISSTSGIRTAPQLVINQGQSYTSLLIETSASGTISVSGDGLKSHSASITKVAKDIKVKLAISPNITATDSFGYYYVWLEKDGDPFNLPTTVVDVILHSSNPNIMRLSLNPPQYQNENSASISMTNGIGRGVFYTGQSGLAILSASIAQFGSASASVFVGPASIGSNNLTDGTIPAEFTKITDSYPDTANYVSFDIFPSLTSKKAYGVAALFFADSNESLEITLDDKENQISSIIDVTRLYPMTTDGRIITVSSSSGLTHDGIYEMSEHQIKTHAVEFEIIGYSNGIYDVELSAAGIQMQNATVEIRAPDTNQYMIKIIPLPAQTGIIQDVAIICIVDMDGNLIDANNTLGSNVTMNVFATSAKLSSSTITFDSGNVGVLRGVLTGTSTLGVTSNELGLQNKQINPAGVATSLELLSPDFVHVGEKFPYVIHEMDSLNIPLEKTSAGFSSSLGIKSVDEYFILNTMGDENITILSDIGADQHEIRSFLNPLDMITSIDKTHAQVGDKITLDVYSTVSGVDYLITSPFPYEQTSDTQFVITPNSEIINASILVSASKDGYQGATDTVLVSSEHITLLQIDSISNDIGLMIPYIIHGITNSDGIDGTTPQTYEIKPSLVTVTFPIEHTLTSGGYKFQNITINDTINEKNTVSLYTEQNYTITAHYTKQVQITINDGMGSGVYLHGDIVEISAPEKEKLFFLVRDVFDHWEGSIDQNTSLFFITATDDVVITAIYREDYTYLMMILLGVVGVVMGIVLRNDDLIYVYKIKSVFDFILYKKLSRTLKPKNTKQKKS